MLLTVFFIHFLLGKSFKIESVFIFIKYVILICVIIKSDFKMDDNIPCSDGLMRLIFNIFVNCI